MKNSSSANSLFSLLRLAISHGYNTLEDSWLHKNNDIHNKRYASWFDPNLFALSLTRLLDGLHVTIYFESQISEVHKKNNLLTLILIVTVSILIGVICMLNVNAKNSNEESLTNYELPLLGNESFEEKLNRELN